MSRWHVGRSFAGAFEGEANAFPGRNRLCLSTGGRVLHLLRRGGAVAKVRYFGVVDAVPEDWHAAVHPFAFAVVALPMAEDAADEDGVPALFEVDGYRGAEEVAFLCERGFFDAAFAPAGPRQALKWPAGRVDSLAVEPDVSAVEVPAALFRGAGSAVSAGVAPHAVDSEHEVDVLFAGAVDVRLRVACARFAADVFRHEGGPVVEAVAVAVHVEHGVQVADVDCSADGGLFFPSQGAAVLYVFVLDGFFGFKGGVVVAFVVEGADESPFDTGLFDVGEGLACKGAVAVDDEAVFEVGECFPFGGVFLRQVGHEVTPFGIAAFPDAFGKGEGTRVEGVLFDDAVLAAQGSVAPYGHDGAESPVVAFRDAARLLEPDLVDTGLAVHPVEVEAVAVDVAAGGGERGAGFVFTPTHGDGFRISRVTGVPDDRCFSVVSDGFDGFGDEFRHGDAYFV